MCDIVLATSLGEAESSMNVIVVYLLFIQVYRRQLMCLASVNGIEVGNVTKYYSLKMDKVDPKIITFMDNDLHLPGNVLISTKATLRTFNIFTKASELIAGHKNGEGYVEGFGAEARFENIVGFAQLNDDLVAVADQGSHCIRMINRLTQETLPFVGRCRSHSRDVYKDLLDILFNGHIGQIAFDSLSQTLYVLAGKHIYKVDYKRSIIELFASEKSGANLRALTLDSTRKILYLLSGDFLIKFEISKKLFTVLSGGTGFADGLLKEARFQLPLALLSLNDDTLVIADSFNHRLRLVDLKLKGFVTSICSVDSSASTSNGGSTDCAVGSFTAVVYLPFFSKLMISDEHFIYSIDVQQNHP